MGQSGEGARVVGVDAMGQSGEGARVVVRAWTDAAFKAKLLEDANGACGELGIDAVNRYRARPQ
ncbi:hypothetical protein T484DRAFT_1811490 [Baffinella frigidus]|nr:hypothetical protein T484DRAFT_1811490 [Cryptophyta sp. CCMP2293]